MYTACKHAVKGFTDTLCLEVEQVDGAPVSITLVEPTLVYTLLPQHARNYMDREPTLPSPKLDPHQVANAILDAAITPRRDVKVGVIATLDVAVQKPCRRWVTAWRHGRCRANSVTRRPNGQPARCSRPAGMGESTVKSNTNW